MGEIQNLINYKLKKILKYFNNHCTLYTLIDRFYGKAFDFLFSITNAIPYSNHQRDIWKQTISIDEY